jgi:hypothetical protein
MNNEIGIIESDGRVHEATKKQMMDYWIILTNVRGDKLWRFFDGDDGEPRWKVWAVETADRTAIKNLKQARPGADYFDTNLEGQGGPRFLGTDYIIPKKYLMRVAKRLGLKLQKGKPKLVSEHQMASLQKAQAVLSDRRNAQKSQAA